MDHLGDGIYELRIRDGRLRIRLLYFFEGVGLAVIVHGFIKKSAGIPEREMRVARLRRRACHADLAAHLFHPEH